jgi:hypothetical protein
VDIGCDFCTSTAASALFLTWAPRKGHPSSILPRTVITPIVSAGPSASVFTVGRLSIEYKLRTRLTILTRCRPFLAFKGINECVSTSNLDCDRPFLRLLFYRHQQPLGGIGIGDQPRCLHLQLSKEAIVVFKNGRISGRRPLL